MLQYWPFFIGTSISRSLLTVDLSSISNVWTSSEIVSVHLFFSLSGSYLPVSLYASWVFCWNLDNWMLWYGKFGNKILLPWGSLFSIVDGCNHLFNFYFKLFLQWLCFLSCVFSEVSSFSCIQEVFWQRFSRT